MQSLSRYTRSNQINKQWLNEYLNEAHNNGLQSVRCHCNIIAWAENGEELPRVKNDVGSALALMECTPHHNTTDLPALYWADIPGNEADFRAEETFYTFTPQALCFFTAETCYRNSPSPFGIRLVDRLTGKLVFLDIPHRREGVMNSAIRKIKQAYCPRLCALGQYAYFISSFASSSCC